MPDDPSPEPTDAEVARYVAEMCAELRRLVQGRTGMRTLAYLVDMARIEAERVGKVSKER